MLRYSYYIGTYVWFQDPNSISTQFLTNTNYYSPKGFILTQKELLELEEKSHLTVSDIRFFAELALRKGIEQEEILETVFTWLSDAGVEKYPA